MKTNMCHVLIIEDEWLIADYLEHSALEAGATSTETVDGKEDAVAAAVRQRPGIILSDVNICQGTGPKAVEAILSQLGSVPVIFVTGNPDECRPCDPPAVVLTKPVQHNLLLETFKQLTGVH